MKQLLTLLALTAVPLSATALEQCPASAVPIQFCTSTAPNVVCVEWRAPTTNDNGTPLSAAQKPLRFRLWRRLPNGDFFPTEIGTQNLFLRVTREPLGEQCYAVSAIDKQDRESGVSCYVCKTLRFPGPTNGSIEAPSDGSIEDKK
jgi:hypothetical protein